MQASDYMQAECKQNASKMDENHPLFCQKVIVFIHLPSMRLIELQRFMIAPRRLRRGLFRGVLVLIATRSILPRAVPQVRVVIHTSAAP